MSHMLMYYLKKTISFDILEMKKPFGFTILNTQCANLEFFPPEMFVRVCANDLAWAICGRGRDNIYTIGETILVDNFLLCRKYYVKATYSCSFH